MNIFETIGVSLAILGAFGLLFIYVNQRFAVHFRFLKEQLELISMHRVEIKNIHERLKVLEKERVNG